MIWMLCSRLQNGSRGCILLSSDGRLLCYLLSVCLFVFLSNSWINSQLSTPLRTPRMCIAPRMHVCQDFPLLFWIRWCTRGKACRGGSVGSEIGLRHICSFCLVKQALPQYRLPALYLVDSLCKSSAGQSFAQHFEKNIAGIYTRAYRAAQQRVPDPHMLIAFEKLYRSWRVGGMFSDRTLSRIEKDLGWPAFDPSLPPPTFVLLQSNAYRPPNAPPPPQQQIAGLAMPALPDLYPPVASQSAPLPYGSFVPSSQQPRSAPPTGALPPPQPPLAAMQQQQMLLQHLGQAPYGAPAMLVHPPPMPQAAAAAHRFTRRLELGLHRWLERERQLRAAGPDRSVATSHSLRLKIALGGLPALPGLTRSWFPTREEWIELAPNLECFSTAKPFAETDEEHAGGSETAPSGPPLHLESSFRRDESSLATTGSTPALQSAQEATSSTVERGSATSDAAALHQMLLGQKRPASDPLSLLLLSTTSTLSSSASSSGRTTPLTTAPSAAGAGFSSAVSSSSTSVTLEPAASAAVRAVYADQVATNICFVCLEAFEQEYDEEKEEFYYKGVVVDEETGQPRHRTCHPGKRKKQ